MSGLILTPGFETSNSSSANYTVYVAKADVGSEQEINQEPDLFLNPLVKGALFFQHHMMHANQYGDMEALPKKTIKAQIDIIHKLSQQRIKNNMPGINLAFDAEPTPVQQRRFYRNPSNWPTNDLEQIQTIKTLTETGALTEFLAVEIVEKGYYPLLPSQQSLASLAEDNIDLAKKVAYAIGAITAHALGSLGIDTLYAPVVDINAAAFPERCYGENPEVIVALAEQWSLGATSNENIKQICYKHAPGHGIPICSTDGEIDTHNAICRTNADLDTIKSHMRIFSELQKRVMDHGVTADSIQMMTNHIIYSEIDPGLPISLSKSGIDFIQSQLSVPTKLVADCVNMASFSQGQENFKTDLAQALRLHHGGVIATTHYVKKASRKEMLSSLDAQLK